MTERVKRKLVILGDKTSNGGEVKTARSSYSFGTEETGFIKAALIGDTASCPVCSIEARIIPCFSQDAGLPTCGDAPLALDGDLVDCKCEHKPHVMGTSNAAYHDGRTA